jgi:hypothetical protein
MTDCSQLQTMLDAAIQTRLALDSPTYCEDNFDTITEQELCRKRLPQQKREADQEIANLRALVETCSALIGAWMLTVDGAVEASGHYEGQFTIESWDDQTMTGLGTMSLPNGEPDPQIAPTASISVIYPYTGDSGQIPPSAHRIFMSRPADTSPAEQYDGTLDVSTQPPTMGGTMSIGGPGIVGIPKVWNWAAQKLP